LPGSEALVDAHDQASGRWRVFRIQ
jgi:hypothetical protein